MGNSQKLCMGSSRCSLVCTIEAVSGQYKFYTGQPKCSQVLLKVWWGGLSMVCLYVLLVPLSCMMSAFYSTYIMHNKSTEVTSSYFPFLVELGLVHLNDSMYEIILRNILGYHQLCRLWSLCVVRHDLLFHGIYWWSFCSTNSLENANVARHLQHKAVFLLKWCTKSNNS